jgi:hypothetical protein
MDHCKISQAISETRLIPNSRVRFLAAAGAVVASTRSIILRNASRFVISAARRSRHAVKKPQASAHALTLPAPASNCRRTSHSQVSVEAHSLVSLNRLVHGS